MIYLDNAATSFKKPEKTYEYINDCMRHISANPGRGSHRLSNKAAMLIYETRVLLAKLFNILDPLSIVFTKNCTEALNVGITTLLNPGDHVITTMMEHNSVLRPLYNLTKQGVEWTIIKSDKMGLIDVKDIESNIQSNTKMIIMTQSSNLTGTIMPYDKVGEICSKNEIIFFLDAAQGAGVLDINVIEQHIDLLAFPGHKSLFGPMGIGGLYISPKIKDMKFYMNGGTGSESSNLNQPDFLPDKYESGTLNLPGIAGLKAGVEFVLETGIQHIKQYDEKLVKLMIEGICSTWNITSFGPNELAKRTSILAFNIGDLDSAFVAQLLDEEYNIAVRPGLHCAPLAHKNFGTTNQGLVRASVNYLTTIEEIEILIESIQKIVKNTKFSIR